MLGPCLVIAATVLLWGVVTTMPTAAQAFRERGEGACMTHIPCLEPVPRPRGNQCGRKANQWVRCQNGW